MSDLISRKSVLEKLEKIFEQNLTLGETNLVSDIVAYIMIEPTAYSVENVVEELEIERKTANNTYNSFNMDVDLGRVFGLEKAIEIVKHGGVGKGVE